jgi:hypothetical protein
LALGIVGNGGRGGGSGGGGRFKAVKVEVDFAIGRFIVSGAR